MSKLLCAAGIVVCGSVSGSALGSLMVFDNAGGQFPWSLSSQLQGPFLRGQGLDITQSAAQSGAANPFTILYRTTSTTTTGMVITTDIVSEGANVRVAADGQPVQIVNSSGQVFTFTAARTYQAGELVGPSASWQLTAAPAAYGLSIGDVPLLGTSAIVGVRLSISGSFHYGWVALEWDPVTTVNNHFQYRPTMWAYETAANTPALVTVPAPGAAGALVMCAGIAGIRRRAR